MANDKIIIAIGDWGNPPHHATPKVDRKNRPRLIRLEQLITKCEVKIPPEQLQPEQQPSENQRLCECGTPLEFRQRCCEKCRVRRRKASNRKAQRKHTRKKRANISS